jgi:hypothetical protein
MSFIDGIKSSFEEHPIGWSLGGIAFVGIIYIYYHTGSKTAAPINVSYSTGPSAAQVAAGTQLAIAQSQGQTAVSLANIQASAGTQEATDYLSYLKTNSANSLTALLSNNATATGINASNNATTLGVTNANNTTGMSELAAYLQASLQSQNASEITSTNQLNAELNSPVGTLTSQLQAANASLTSVSATNQSLVSQKNTLTSALQSLYDNTFAFLTGGGASNASASTNVDNSLANAAKYF